MSPRSPELFDPALWTDRVYRGGSWIATERRRTAVCPADGSAVGSVGVASTADVDVAVRLATQAQRDWAARPFGDRAAVLREAARLLEADRADYVELLVAESGSARGKAGFELGLILAELHLGAALPLLPTGEILQSARPRLSMAARIPVGVVGVISPFNFPGVLAMRSLAPALALGNAVILKPDPRTAIAGGLLLAALFERAGLPAGVLSVLPGDVDVGVAIVEHPGIPVISFTGSTAAGRRIGERAGALLKRAHLELGGNSALVVLPDADVDAAVRAGAWGSFLHQGQICMTTGRHLVHSSLHERYLEGLVEAARRLEVGDPRSADVPLGPVIDERQRDHVHGLVTASVSAGATLLAGGRYRGLYYEPTVLAVTSPEQPAFAEEVFGPVAPVMAFDSEEELVEIVGRSEYGLSLGILTADVMRGLELARRLPSGIVHINDQTVDDEAVAPFGGIAASGTGARFGGVAANVEAFTHTRWITAQGRIERYPF
ncbi:MAG: benzaldehyde dehydrogenase [Microbacteriaceae bacterium]